MRKVLIPLFVLAIVSAAIFMGQQVQQKAEKWNVDPRSTQIYADPNAAYVPAPVLNDNFQRLWDGPKTVATPTGMVTINPNFRVHPSANSQSEVPISRHPTNPQIMFASSNAVTSSVSFISEGMYLTTNGGTTWFGSDTTAAAPLTNHGGDPAPAIGPNGYLYQSFLGYSTAGMYASYSSNMGTSWAATTTIISGSMDKNHTFVNDVAASPYYGRVYVTWSLFTASAPPCVVSYSTNNGSTYSAYVTVATPLASHYHQGVNGAIMPNGDAVICWQSPITSGSYTGDYIGFGKSTDGGATWASNNNIYDCNGIRGTLFAAAIRVNDFPWMGIDRTGGARNGWIYIATAEKSLAPAGSDADIVLHKSTDGGTTWSAGVRVNQDALNNGKVQYMPCLKVDENGGVNVVYYDNRNVTGDSVQVYVSRSVDGGATWTDILVSDHAFKPGSISGLATGYQGDYIGITAGNSKLYPYWADNKSGIYQAWMTTIDLGPAINHTPLGNTEQTTGNRVVSCTITPAGSGINPSLTKLYYAKNSTTWSNVSLSQSGITWTANLPLSGVGTYNYYLTTTDSSSRTATAPSGAPASYYSFNATPDTIKPVIVHTPIGNTPKTTWPISVTASVTDNIGVDSAWVRWRINSGATKQFKILNTSGSTYTALFNSVNSDVTPGDIIYYRIFAQDNSSNHNRDSSALYNFTIINLTTSCIGTGTVAMGSTSGPFNTYWYGNRTNILWTSAEIIANGGAIGNITRIGFDINTVGGQAMTGLTIRLQNTALTTLTGFTPTGWTTAYSNTYTVPGTGMQYIDLTTPFAWNGTNLLIEICFQNLSYSTATIVNGTTISGMEYTEYHDLSTACSYTGFTAPTAQTARANVCFVIAPVLGVNPINSNLPASYNLSQNYPNPFNPTTKINFAIPKQGLVTLKIYDILGREVANLINEVKAAGFYSVDFNASELSSGVYFYRVDVNGFSDIKKMVLMK